MTSLLHNTSHLAISSVFCEMLGGFSGGFDTTMTYSDTMLLNAMSAMSGGSHK